MNANELADAIEKGGKDGFFQDEVVAILRQQQAEIEALKQSKFEGNNKVNSELTDEEIDKVWDLGDKYLDIWHDGTISAVFYYDFARAILRKAQEK